MNSLDQMGTTSPDIPQMTENECLLNEMNLRGPQIGEQVKMFGGTDLYPIVDVNKDRQLVAVQGYDPWFNLEYLSPIEPGVWNFSLTQ